MAKLFECVKEMPVKFMRLACECSSASAHKAQSVPSGLGSAKQIFRECQGYGMRKKAQMPWGICGRTAIFAVKAGRYGSIACRCRIK